MSVLTKMPATVQWMLLAREEPDTRPDTGQSAQDDQNHTSKIDLAAILAF